MVHDCVNRLNCVKRKSIGKSESIYFSSTERNRMNKSSQRSHEIFGKVKRTRNQRKYAELFGLVMSKCQKAKVLKLQQKATAKETFKSGQERWAKPYWPCSPVDTTNSSKKRSIEMAKDACETMKTLWTLVKDAQLRLIDRHDVSRRRRVFLVFGLE